MTDPDAPTRFKVLCCKVRRSLLPAGILICMSCDAGLHVPNGADLTDVPAGITSWPPR